MSNSPAAIVTGGASGLGLEITKSLLSQGWSVVIADINPAGATVAKSLGSEVLFVHTDTAVWEQQVQLFQQAFAWRPLISTLAANAGISSDLTASTGIMISDIELGAPQIPSLRVLDVNTSGTIFSIKLFLHHFLKQNTTPGARGKIIITGSEGGLFALPPDPVYSASKHALVGLARSLGPAFLQAHGITVNSINPGYMKTTLVAPLIPITPEKYETPLDTVVAAFHELLRSDKTGQILEVSGKNIYYQNQQAYPNEVSRWLWEDAPAFWGEAIASMGRHTSTS